MAKPELRDHRKFLRLRRLLGEPTPHVLGYLDCLWHRGYQTGNPLIGDGLDVESAAEYPGETGKFTEAAEDAGFIDRDEKTGLYSIHDLFDHAPEYAKKRMARVGNLPDGLDAYSGITPKKNSRRVAKTVKQTPHSGENSETDAARRTEPRTKNQEPKSEIDSLADKPPDPPVSEKNSQRDELFDVIAEVTGTDPKASGSHIGRVKKSLLAAEPPYTPEEIRKWADPVFQARELPWKKGEKPTLGEIEKYIGRIRNPSSKETHGRQQVISGGHRVEPASGKYAPPRREEGGKPPIPQRTIGDSPTESSTPTS